MKRKIFISVLCLALALSFSACNKKEASNSGTIKNETASQKDDDKKVTENKKTKNKDIEEVDDKVLNFTSKYLEQFDDNSYSCILINFKNDDFIPEDIREKIKTINVSKYGKPGNGIEKGYKPYKSLVINLREGALYKISTTADKIDDLRFIKGAYLAKGDALLLENADKFYNINIYSADEIDGISNCYPFTTYNNESPEKRYTLYRWLQKSQPSFFVNDRMYTEKDNATSMTANIDLNGDGMKDIVSIKAIEQKENVFSDKLFFSSLKWKILINDKEFDLMSFDKLKNFEDVEKYIRIYIQDFDKSDKYKEIFIDIAGNEYNIFTEVFRYDNGELTHIGSMERKQAISFSNNTKDGICLMPNINYGLGFNYLYDRIYSIKDGKVVEEVQDVKKIHYSDSEMLGTLKVDLNLYEKVDSEKKSDVLKKGEVICLQETDDKSWIKVKSIETGKSGYLLVTINEENGSINFKDQEALKLESFEEAIDGIYDGEG
ncbi:hypothetical protein HMPREF0379_0389 [[Eubacterium] yurii subsp. margaretiae ATCC 43715]|nr:hypothetical protein HMPREF0379_0389 [[Eubacterium] yurii subsp. margaretiae ATCC 43715]